MEKVRGWAASHPQAGDPVLTDGEYLERLEEEVKLLREREKLLEAVAEAAKRRELASRGIDNGPERVTADILLWNELETLAAYDARKGTDEVPKVR